MQNPDSSREALAEIITAYSDFLRSKENPSEADTRVKVIDRILTEVCGWPESTLRREEHVESGFIDYVLAMQSRPYVAVEAKKSGVTFTLPATPNRTLKLNGTLLTDSQIAMAIKQVRTYCDDSGIRYAIITNGLAWIVFRAIREDMPWREGPARIFPSLDHIYDNFTAFWNLLSFDAIQAGSLDAEFGNRLNKPRDLIRITNNLYNADLPLQRNRLHSQLHRLIETVFEDIAQQDPIEILSSCYVHTESLRIVANNLNVVITDDAPAFLQDEGTVEIVQGPHHTGAFGAAVAQDLKNDAGQLYLILGGIGSGKTTFIRRYQRVAGKSALDHNALWFHIDFLRAPLDAQNMELFAWRTILEQLRTRYQNPNLETNKLIKQAFKDNIEALRQTGLFHLHLYGDKFDAAVAPYLEKWQADIPDYVPRLLRVAKESKQLRPVVFVDNVDQLAPEYQARVFMLAQTITKSVGSITILALREESFYSARVQKTLSAYTSKKFHIASPQFRQMIGNRIHFALDILKDDKDISSYILPIGYPVDRSSIGDFLRIIETSIFKTNHNIARLIESLCFGNMRQALEMFTMFMTSGATDVDKMINIYRRSGSYYVAFHEFVKSIMLGERRYYKESSSYILNMFDCGAERNSSHFTHLRILLALAQRRSESTRIGDGFVEIARLLSQAEDIFDNKEEMIRSLNRLVARQLVEPDTKSSDSITGASHVRITSSGIFYLEYLVRSFSYLDLVLQDTPFNDTQTERDLRDRVYAVDNLTDRDDEKVSRMKVRFDRVRIFLEYLRGEEIREFKDHDLAVRGALWSSQMIPPIIDKVEEEIGWIERRISENRERYADEPVIKSVDLDAESNAPEN